jgi:hypothetical protein
MFAYNPTVNDRSGEILGAGQMQAAQTNAQAMNQMGQDIGGALQTIGGMYGEIEGQKAKGRAFKDVFKVVSPSLGISMEQLESVAGGKIKSDRDWFQVSEMMMPMMPALINMQLGQQRIGVQRDQQNLAAAGPAIRSANTNAAAVSSQGGPSLPGASRRFGN